MNNLQSDPPKQAPAPDAITPQETIKGPFTPVPAQDTTKAAPVGAPPVKPSKSFFEKNKG